jgi:tRNA-specific 2-thiouridylase
VKTIANSLGLKGLGPESREICFIPDSNYKRFLVKNIGDHIMKAGDIVDTSGSVLGRHYGIYGFTIGQRRGIGIPSDRPYYVKDFDVKNNLVIVGRKEELLSRGLVTGDVNWIAISRPDGKLEVKTRVRYRHREAESAIECYDDRVRVIFAKPQKAITPGQAAVFYESDKLIGGGWIESAIEN